jgi:acetylornithine deacetylase/succinyl-diaminopimelate desuccinylase-like protein
VQSFELPVQAVIPDPFSRSPAPSGSFGAGASQKAPFHPGWLFTTGDVPLTIVMLSITIGAEPLPIVEPAIPVVEEPLPIGKLGIPVVEEPLPIVELPIPVVAELLPVGKLEIPVVEGPLPIVELPITVVDASLTAVELTVTPGDLPLPASEAGSGTAAPVRSAPGPEAPRGGSMSSRRVGLAVLLAVVSCVPYLNAQTAAPEPAELRSKVRAWRTAHEKEIVRELADLVALPNVVVNRADIERNADHLIAMLRRRGIEARRLTAGDVPPAVYGELRSPGATRTIVFYAHYDGQPADPADWGGADPWKPVLRTGLPSQGGREVDLASAASLDPEWRLFARSTSDDKGPIVAMLAALDALRAAGVQPSVNIKFFLEGEEEDGSPHLTEILHAHRDLLAADAWILADGPVHQTRRMQVVFGARGALGLEMTVYGPLRGLHSGHYGNWAPNPAALLVELLAGLRAPDGAILIPGINEAVRPLTESERQAAAAMPAVEPELQRELALAWTEGNGGRLQDLVMRPALNLRGLAAAQVGEKARNAIPTEAAASIDFRLVPDLTPEIVRDKLEAHLRRQGFWVVQEEPDAETRRAHPRIVRLLWGEGYPGARTSMDLPASRAVVEVVGEAVDGPLIQVPMLGGSVPMYLFTEALQAPVIIVPIVNHDNNQHAAHENLRLQNLWDGIEVFAQLFVRLGRAWPPSR